VIFPEHFEHKIDFIKIRELVKEHCLGTLGRSMVDEMQFMTQILPINQRLTEVSEFKLLLGQSDNFPSEYFFDLRKALAKLNIDGTYLETNELFDLRRSLQTIKAIVQFFKSESNSQNYPTLKAISDKVVLYPYVFDGIDRILNKQGKIKDNASSELARIRKEYYQKQATAAKLIHRIIADAQQEGWVEADATLSMRDGRAVIPVQASFKRKIAGIVHDESATGKTSYIEPAPVVEINNQLAELEAAERREIIKILREFTDTIRPYANDLEDSVHFLGIIDFIRAKAQFAIRIHARQPKLVDEPLLNWHEAVHPLLFLAFNEEGRKVVPLTISLNAQNRILLISGPNAGGKSVCLKTVGLLQYMVQCGLLIPVEDESQSGIFKNLFIDIGDEQSIENDLSTYSSHLLYMKHFARHADDKTLILIDEFGTGTEPMLGGAIAEAILNKLNQLKVFGVITTHYTNLKHFASSADGIVNGAMLYDTNRLEPMFQLEIGKPGSSFAFEIAYKIGLPQDVIEEARNKVGEDHINFDKHLRDILRDKNYWERKRLNIRKIERRLEEMMEKEKDELEQARQLRKTIVEKAETEAKKLVTESNKVIENTVRKIKEAQAEKGKTKEARKELETFKEKLEQKDSTEEERIARKMQKLREREHQIKKEPSQKISKEEKTEETSPFAIGLLVRIMGQTTVGEIMDLSESNAVVAFGSLLTSVSTEKLEPLTKTEIKALKKRSPQTNFKQAYELNERRLRFKPGLDIRGKRADEAIQLVTEFIDEAIMLGVHEVKILHGKGNGILRQLIREYLSTVNVVQKAHDESIEFGGAGITVVSLG